jgi:manganese transport protein
LIVIPIIIGCLLLLLYISIPQSWRRKRPAPVVPAPGFEIAPQKYSKLGVALDYSALDEKVLTHAHSLALLYGAELCLFHVVEGISGQLFGKNAYDAEAREDRELLEKIADRLRASGVKTTIYLGYGRVPNQLIQLSIETKIDLLIMGGHRHRGLDDILFGASISKVRHRLSIPVLVAQ